MHNACPYARMSHSQTTLICYYCTLLLHACMHLSAVPVCDLQHLDSPSLTGSNNNMLYNNILTTDNSATTSKLDLPKHTSEVPPALSSSKTHTTSSSPNPVHQQSRLQHFLKPTASRQRRATLRKAATTVGSLPSCSGGFSILCRPCQVHNFLQAAESFLQATACPATGSQPICRCCCCCDAGMLRLPTCFTAVTAAATMPDLCLQQHP
jgi:hypothetical protein